jgi:ribonuclease Z
MNVFDLTISGFSTALFSTWLFVEQWRLLFDAGDGAVAGLLTRSRKAETIAVTHADRDHLTGLPQLLQLNGRDQLPRVLYPKDAGSFPALASFLARFDPETSARARWQPVAPEDRVALREGLHLRVLPNAHWVDVPAGQTKCVGYLVEETRRVLRPEFRGHSQRELDVLRGQRGREALTVEETVDLLTFTGDTPIVDPRVWGRPRVLIHEATFLEAERAAASTRRNRHSQVAEAVDVALAVAPEVLVLTHFSSRYAVRQVVEAVRREAAARRAPFPIWVVPPGEVVRDLFRTAPIWSGAR